MSEWQDQIRSHQVWGHLESLGPALDEAATKAGGDPTGLDIIERLRTVNSFCGKRLAALDPALVHLPVLEQVSAGLQSVLTEVQAFVADGMAGHLVNAQGHASAAVLGHLPGLLMVATSDELTGLSEAAAGYRNSMQRAMDLAEQSVSHVQAEATALAQKLVELTAELTAERSRVATLVNDFQSQFSSAQDNRAKEFNEAQAIRLKEFGEAHSSRQTRFDELMTSYGQRLNDQDAESSKQREQLRQQMTADMSALQSEYQASAQSILDQILQHKADVEKLVGVIGNLGVTSGHLRAAETAKRSMWLWQGLTLLGLVSVIGFAVFAFLPALQREFSWEAFAGRVVLTLAVGVFAAYSAAQADRFMESERRNRKLALELEALGPYLAPLPEEKQQEFRLAVGDRTFGRDEPGLSRRDKSPATALDVFLTNKDLQRVIAEIVKNSKS